MIDKDDETLQYPPASEIKEPVEYQRPGYYVEIHVEKVYGCCPHTLEGDKYNYVGFTAMETGLCGIAEYSLHPYISGLSLGVKAVDMGIAKSGDDGYVMCPSWGPPTCEAQIIFRLHPVPVEKMPVDAWYEALAQTGHHCVPAYFLEKFGTEELRASRKNDIEEWVKAGRPKFWEGWRNMPAQRFATENRGLFFQAMKDMIKKE